MEFQGQVVTWLNENISKHSGMGLDRAMQEKPRSSSGKRNDLVVWQSRVSLIAFLSFELKTLTHRSPTLFFSLTPWRRRSNGGHPIL